MNFKNKLRKLLNKNNFDTPEINEISRISKIPRFQYGVTEILNSQVAFVDSASFLGSYDEIFKKEVYKFNADDSKPLTIIDCGANIGLATLYFKLNYSNVRILAYEPDPNIFSVLKKNIESFNLKNVELFNEAIGIKKEKLFFNMEGGHSGMIVKEPSNKTVSVNVTPLRDILKDLECIDFLKIDIEGYEINVLPDIIKDLKKVNVLFLEYHTFINEQQELSKIFRIIEQAGFRYYIKEAGYKKSPFIERELFYKMDMLVNIFCYR